MESAAATWLARQCQGIRGATRGVLLLGESPLAERLAAHWPAPAGEPTELVALARAAAAEGRVVVEGEPAQGAPRINRLAVPFKVEPGMTGCAAVEIEQPSGSRAVVDALRSGIGWLELLLRREQTAPLVSALELLGTCLVHERFEAAALALATELSQRLGCERVSIGFRQRGQMRVEAVSHSARFDERSGLIRAIGLAMDEAADQDATVVFPPEAAATPRATRNHEALVALAGGGPVCTIPLASAGRLCGALTLERATGERFPAASVSLAEHVASLAGPVLVLKREADMRPLARAREWLREGQRRLFGPAHTAFKAGVSGVVAVFLLLTLVKTEYRIAADATLEGSVQRALVAGIDGYIAEASARAGDLVKRGQVLGRLDDRDLILEQRKLQAQREQIHREHREALAGHNRTQVKILAARLAQAEAELSLLDEQRRRTQLVAPFDGIVVKGDLSQALGAPVARGDVLFELAPLEGYRIILKVDEHDVADVRPQALGELALASLPGQPLALRVERVTPVAIAEAGQNYFRVEARVEQPVAALRPGMEGIGKIDVDRRRLVWVWTHDLLDWLRVWLWKWWP